MIDGFTAAQVIGAMAGFIIASYLAFFGWLVTSVRDLRKDMHELNRELRNEMHELNRELRNEMHDLNRETRLELTARIDALGTKADAIANAVSRLEGTVYRSEPRRPSE